ncbi:hypothetical protein HG535_0F00970 [Zygotorulaspora mrakii]|uniref:Uncharacterized protein n=1 Tax=Zygotorulaspora mrakii TaxID=42260 RepID=A0A7H9B4W9_ZYGMR|nr:uncharacterized protein HG535_0F00970 [Zygotorulaspora mrakii]QLG73587.1 hypothetical protein HG535_0F00970 [Zygotorulaspora mrakii]
MFSQGSIPEVKEDVIGYALNERKLNIPQFKDLGPPDLITMIKYIPSNHQSYNNTGDRHHQHHKNGSAALDKSSNGETSAAASTNGNVDQTSIVTGLHSKDKLKGEIGTFFYSMGVDASDPTSIAVYLKTIADTISEEGQVWFGKTKNFNVAKISFSTWNTFRKCDLNVVVHIPGTVQTFILDSQGEQLQMAGHGPETERDHELLWAETFFSGVVRAIMLMRDNREEGEVQNLVETLILNPLTSGQLESVSETFIALFPLVYENGPHLGGPCDVTNITKVNNYLIETLVEIVKITKSVDQCRSMLEQLMVKNPEVVVILARVLLTNDMEIDAIDLINGPLLSLQDDSLPPHLDYKCDLLSIQAEFLIDIKQDYKLAAKIGQAAVNCAPSEFRPWYLLARSYIKLNDVENALLTLNSCPMTPLKEKYALKRVAPIPSDSSLHLPLPVDVIFDDISSLDPLEIQREHKNADASLVNLAASNLKSVFQLAYKLLTEVVQITGWEALLKYRSKIFVMEEEYQISSTDEVDKSKDETQTPSKSPENISDRGLRSKRLCERWLDNLFMLLYEDLKTYTLWQTEQLYFEAQYSKYNKLTFEWELFGLCARRLGHYPEAARAFQTGLSQRFSAECSRRLLEYCIKERQKVRLQSGSPNSEMSSSQIIGRINELDSTIIDLVVKICCWNHRWYIEFSLLLINSLSEVIQDMGLTKISSEISSKYPESVYQLLSDNFLDFFTKYTNSFYDT